MDDAAVGRRTLVNSAGNLGGFVGLYMVGYLSEATGSNYAGMLFLAVLIALSGILAVFAVLHDRAMEEVEGVIDPVSSAST